MHLGRHNPDVLREIKPLYPIGSDDYILVARNKSLWLLTLKEARYIKQHIARLSPTEIASGMNPLKEKAILERLSVLKKKGVL